MKKNNDKEYLLKWKQYCDNARNATPVDMEESHADKLKRIKNLEANPEEWFKWYFPNFCYAEPAAFHKASTKRIISNPEWFEVRAWSRELAKSARTMMEALYLSLTGKKKNWILVSNSEDNATRLLLPYKANLEANNRIINDYGVQRGIGSWEKGEFITKSGVSFRAVGAQQSPRGTRANEIRPDGILIDDIDTDEECRNSDIIANKIKWIEEALIPTRSISNPLLIIVCGNLIAEYCCVSELTKKADKVDIVNIRDKNGKSTWASKNTEAMIDRVLSTISYESSQKEYFNNPMTTGKVFKSIHDSKVPPLKKCDSIFITADPATSNKTATASSSKCIAIVVRKDLKYYVYKCWLDQMTNSRFVEYMFEAVEEVKRHGVETVRVHIENNSLQDPFYEQVYEPLINDMNKRRDTILPITKDERKKVEKYERIEATLEPINSQGRLYFNEAEASNPHMERMKTQFRGVHRKAKQMDGPDTVEAAVSLDKIKMRESKHDYIIGYRESRKY